MDAWGRVSLYGTEVSPKHPRGVHGLPAMGLMIYRFASLSGLSRFLYKQNPLAVGGVWRPVRDSNPRTHFLNFPLFYVICINTAPCENHDLADSGRLRNIGRYILLCFVVPFCPNPQLIQWMLASSPSSIIERIAFLHDIM